jgi:hypothetical protein
LPHFITEEQFLEIKKVAQEKAQEMAKRVYCQELKEGVRKAQKMAFQPALYQEQALKQRPYQAAIQPYSPQPLFTSPDQGILLNPCYIQQQVPQTIQYQHAQQTAHYPQQQYEEQAVDYMSFMPGNYTAPNNLQQQVAQMTSCQSPMQGHRAPSYNAPRVAAAPHHSLMPGNQATFSPSPQGTQMAPSKPPQQARQVSSYISSVHPSQVVGYQSLPINQMAALNIPQQAAQMGAYPSMQQTSQFAQQERHFQPQAYNSQLQQPQQPGKYYAPIPVMQPIGYGPQYDPQNQAQVVAQQYRMQQDQMQRQQIEQSGMQYQPSLQDNLRNSAAMVPQANAANPTSQFTVEDFLPQRH